MSANPITEVSAIRRAGPRRSHRGSRPPCRSDRVVRCGLRTSAVMLVVGALLGAMAGPAWAWGRLGHRASARLAESRLSPRARAVVRDLLEPGESLADASTWADEHSRDIRGSAAWHYVNVPISASHYDARDHARRACVVTKIAEFRAVLADRNASRARRREALRFFVHLVQDLHQPFHVADHGDRGGNALQLRYGRYETTNLHQVWDSGLFRWRYRQRAEATLVRDVTELANRPESRNWAHGRVEDWANESLELGRRAYRVPGTDRSLRQGDAIGPDYVDANVPRAVERIAQSGVRLAAMLNEILDD
jgi:nuclease S1